MSLVKPPEAPQVNLSLLLRSCGSLYSVSLCPWSTSGKGWVLFLYHSTVTGICSGFINEQAMATHSNTLAWKIPLMEEPGRLQSMGSLRVGHDWATSLSLFTLMHWRRKWQPAPVFLPGESQGRRGLVGCVYGVTQSRKHDWSNLAAVAAVSLLTLLHRLVFIILPQVWHQVRRGVITCLSCSEASRNIFANIYLVPLP